MKKIYTQFTCITRSLPVKSGKFTCSCAASRSRRTHAIARYKARKSRATSPAGCRLSYLQIPGEFTRGVIADCLQLQIFLGAIAGILASHFAGIFACVRIYFCLRLVGVFTGDSSVFACKLHVFFPVIAGNFTC